MGPFDSTSELLSGTHSQSLHSIPFVALNLIPQQYLVTHIMAQKEMNTETVNKMNAKDADEQTTQDLTEFVQSLLQKMHERFQEMSDSIIGRLDDMGKRLDELEGSIGELMTQAGIDEDLPKSGGQEQQE